ATAAIPKCENCWNPTFPSSPGLGSASETLTQVPTSPRRTTIMVSALRVQGAHKRYGNTHALRGVNFDVEAGQVHALYGPNGAGKSTLMNLFPGVDDLDDGVMFINGNPYRPQDVRHARHLGVGMIYQEPSLPS